MLVLSSPGVSNVMDYITMGTTGNATILVILTLQGHHVWELTSPTRVCINAGGSAPSVSNLIDFIEIATTGNATDFGDLTTTLDSLVLYHLLQEQSFQEMKQVHTKKI